MLTVISPAKKLDLAPAALPDGLTASNPAFHAEAAYLAQIARRLSVADLRRLMHISEPLATLNRDRFAAFIEHPADAAIKPAALAFAGDTYTGLEAKTLDPVALHWAQSHLRILSGLYGLLRPLDSIQAYRLEMGSRLATDRGPTLYDFWGTTIADALNAAASAVGTDTLINCASTEYFGAVNLAALRLRVVTPVFLEDREGDAKIISFWAKKARGAMARFIAEHQLTDACDILAFTAGGYRHCAERSGNNRPVFTRPG